MDCRIDFTFLGDKMLKELLKDHRCFHSEFQQDYFITIKQGTLYAQYKQALRELYKRVGALRESKCNREKLLIEIEEQKSLTRRWHNKFKRGYAAIEYRRKSMQLEECDRAITDTEREFVRFYQQAMALKPQVGELTEGRINQLEEEMFTYRLKEMMISDWLCLGRYSPQTHELLHSLPLPARLQIMKETQNPEDQKDMIDYYTKEDRNHFTDIGKLELEAEQCLLEL